MKPFVKSKIYIFLTNYCLSLIIIIYTLFCKLPTHEWWLVFLPFSNNSHIYIIYYIILNKCSGMIWNFYKNWKFLPVRQSMMFPVPPVEAQEQRKGEVLGTPAPQGCATPSQKMGGAFRCLKFC